MRETVRKEGDKERKKKSRRGRHNFEESDGQEKSERVRKGRHRESKL